MCIQIIHFLSLSAQRGSHSGFRTGPRLPSGKPPGPLCFSELPWCPGSGSHPEPLPCDLRREPREDGAVGLHLWAWQCSSRPRAQQPLRVCRGLVTRSNAGFTDDAGVALRPAQVTARSRGEGSGIKIHESSKKTLECPLMQMPSTGHRRF